MIFDEAVEAAHQAHLAHKAVRSPGDAKKAMEEALVAAAPFLLRKAADVLEDRMSSEEPKSDAEAKYEAGYADAVARLILMAGEPLRSQQ